MSARRRAQRRRDSHGRELRPRAMLDGCPLYDGVIVYVAEGTNAATGERDDRVVIGVGPEGSGPAAVTIMCPCDGVDGLIEELRAAQRRAVHPAH